jgi:hypothetical protein
MKRMRRKGGVQTSYRIKLLLRAACGCVVILGLSDCGKHEEEAFKEPVTVEQAATVLDLSAFPLIDGSKPPWPHGVASLFYEAPGDVKTAFEFCRSKLADLGWKELPNSSVTAQAASATFSREGFVVSVSVFPREANAMSIQIQNHGNIRPARLPLPPNAKPVYVGDLSAMYVTDAPVMETAEACYKLLLADGWTPYGGAGNSAYYKRNAIWVEATVSSAPAQGGKTMIAYTTRLISADLPAPPDASDLRYTEQNKELTFEIPADKNAVVDFYKNALAEAGWRPTLDHLIQVDEKEEMIFRNQAKDMLTLAIPPASGGTLSVSLQHQSAAEIAELERQIKEHAPEIRAKIKAKQDAEQQENQPKALPKFAVTLPGEINGLEMKKGEIKFKVGNGKAKAVVEAWRKEFRDAGWKEDAVSLEAMAGAASFSKDGQSLTINYTDTGVMPAEVQLSATGVDLETK